jgi:hypothetical protein
VYSTVFYMYLAHSVNKREITRVIFLPFILPKAGILEQSMGARNRVGTGLQYRPDRLHRLADSIPCNRFLGFLNVYEFGFKMLYLPPCLGITVYDHDHVKTDPALQVHSVKVHQ